MRCSECAERNSVAARKCEFCGSKFNKRPSPLSLKLACGGVAVAITASIAASWLVPKLVDPEENLGRVAKTLAAGPTSVEQANKVKSDFAVAMKNFLKTAGDDKTPALNASLQKLLPTSAFEVHIVDLPRGLRVVEIDTVLQASSFLVMKTGSGTKVFDLPAFEVFDDARILNDSAGPVLALVGHSSGPPPHKPMVRTYALLPDSIMDETEKLVPAFKVDGVAKFAKNNQDIQVEFSVPAATNGGGKRAKKNAAPTTERLAFGNLKWKDAHYVSDFGATAAMVASRETKSSNAVVAGGAAASGRAAAVPAAVSAPPAVTTVASAPTAPRGSTTAVVATVPAVAVAPAVEAPSSTNKIVVRGFTAADAARSPVRATATTAVATSHVPPAAAAAAPTKAMSSDSVMAAVPMTAPALKNARSTVESIAKEFTSDKKLSKAERRKRRREAEAAAAAAAAPVAPVSTSSKHAEVIAAGATLRAKPGRGAAAMNSFGTGTKVSVLNKDGEWYHVRVNGQEGYMYSSLISVGKGRSAASVQPARVVASADAGSHSSRHHRRGHSRSGQTVASQEALLVADATAVRHKSRGNKRQVAASEPILVP